VDLATCRLAALFPTPAKKVTHAPSGQMDCHPMARQFDRLTHQKNKIQRRLERGFWLAVLSASA